MRKQTISFKKNNHFPFLLPNQIYDTISGMAVKLPPGEYWYAKAVKKTQRDKRVISAALPARFAKY